MSFRVASHEFSARDLLPTIRMVLLGLNFSFFILVLVLCGVMILPNLAKF